MGCIYKDAKKSAKKPAHNKRFSEMAVGVETSSLMHPSTSVIVQALAQPRPPLRQAAGRYLPFTLLRCEAVDKPSKDA